jgi:PAS domain S-box-containing protein
VDRNKLLPRINFRQRLSSRVFSFLYLSLSFFISFAQSNFKFHRLSVDNGLSQNSVNCIAQDKFGFLWFGTRSGLNKFDGYTFTVFQFNPRDTNSLSDNWINCLSVSANGDLLAGTRYGGIARINTTTNKISRYQHFKDRKNSISSNAVNCILETSKGTLWAGTDKGLNYSSSGKNGFARLENSKDPSFAEAKVTSIFEDKKGNLWIGAYFNELTEYRPAEKKFYRYPEPEISTEKYQITKINEFAPGILMLATAKGLHFFDTYTHRFVNGLIEYSGADSLLRFEVKDFSRDNLGRIWCSLQTPTTLGILACINPSTKKISYLQSDPSAPENLAQETIRAVFKDNSGVMWIGFDGKGLNYFHPSAQKFFLLSKKEGLYGQLSSEYIFAIHEDNDGTLWLGTSDKGVNHYLPKKGATVVLNEGIFSNNYCTTIERADDDKLWFAFTGRDDEGGAILYDKKSGTYKTFDEISQSKNLLGSYKITSIKNEDKCIWFGTMDAGLARYEKSTGKVTRFIHTNEKPGSIAGDEISSIFRDSKKRLWIGTRNGLCLLNEVTGAFTNYVYQSGNPSSLSNNNVLCLHEDSNKNLWIGTAHGLNRFNKENSAFELISTQHNLPDNHIYGILEDEKGNLWLSTNNGLCRYSPKTKSTRNYSIDDGLQSREFNTNSFHLGKNGLMYFGGIGGVNFFHPDSIRDNSFNPPIVITSVNVFGKQIALDSCAFAKRALTLDFEENYLTIDFASLDFLYPEKNRFQCHLEGFDKGWMNLENRNSVSYSNLNPGSYTLHIRGTNDDGMWSTNEAELKIVILPPFYKTMWFYLLTGVILLGIAWLLYRQRVKNLVRTQQELRQQVQLRTSQIEEQKKELVLSHQHLSRISELGLIITSSLDLESIAESVYHGINTLMDASSFAIGIFNSKEEKIDFNFVYDDGKKIEPHSISIHNPESIAAWCFTNKKDILANNSDEIKSYFVGKPIYFGNIHEQLESLIMIPLMAGKNCIGIITTQSSQKNTFTEFHHQTLQSIASYVSSALDNASAYAYLQESKKEVEKLSIVAKETANAVVIMDNNGKIEWVNDGFTRMTGYTLNELHSQLGTTLLQASKNQNISAVLKACLEEKKPMAYEAINKTKDGRIIWVHTSLTPILDEAGNVKKLVAIDSDITDMKNVEERIKASEKQYKILFDRNGDFLFIYDKATHFIMDCNQTFLNVYGYSKQELTSMTPFDLMPVEEHRKLAESIDAASPEQASYFTHITKTGKQLSVEVRSVEILFNGRNAWLVITRDITERKKAEEQILQQRDIIEAKNKDITDSINYAKRIQQATLPTETQLKETFNDHFVFFRPKDIVSGDFYWLGQSEDGKIYFAAADCTGHGVPGAIMSVIGTTKLDEIVTHRPIENPAHAMEQLRLDITSMLNHYGAEQQTDDGIDMVLCSFDFKATDEKNSGVLEFACAKNPLWLVREGKLTEFLPDHFCVGKDDDADKPFTLHRIELKKGDHIYLFSDGFADQFGGKSGKKFKSKKLQELLLSIQDKPMATQKTELEKTLDEWRGEYMQVDDICVVGISI